MKRIGEMNLSELADEVEDGGIFSEYEVSARLREIHAEYERRWNKMSESERLESIAIDGTESVKRRAKERKEKRKQILNKLKELKK
jgi:hypothetical protein